MGFGIKDIVKIGGTALSFLTGPAAPFVAAGANILGGALGNSSAKKAATKQNEWEERMSNTAYQRGTADMIKAGINPMLAVSQGGASTPGGAMAQIPNRNIVGEGVNAALSVAQNKANIANTQANTLLTQENWQKQLMDNKKTATLYGRGIGGLTEDTGLIESELQKLKAESEKARSDADISTTASRMKKIEEQILEKTAGSTIHSAQSAAQIKEKEITAAELRNILMTLDIPEAKAMAEWFETVGQGSPAAKAAMTIGQWLKYILGR